MSVVHRNKPSQATFAQASSVLHKSSTNSSHDEHTVLRHSHSSIQRIDTAEVNHQAQISFLHQYDLAQSLDAREINQEVLAVPKERIFEDR